MTTTPVADLARSLTAADASGTGTASLVPRSRDEWIALAWAVKDECQAAWIAEPPRTQRCADLAAQLVHHCDDPEVTAASAWCHGLAWLRLGRMQEAIGQLDAAYERLRAMHQLQRAAQAQVPKVIALSMLGRHDEALASGHRTLQQLTHVGDELGAGKVELNLGSMLFRLDRYADAASLYRRAAARFARVGDNIHSIMADISLASTLAAQFDFEEAARLYDRCEMRVRAHTLPGLQSAIDTNRGRMDMHRGRFESALRSVAAALHRAEVDGRPQDIAEAQRDLADVYMALNLLPEAIALYGRTIERCLEMDAPMAQAWAELQRARALARGGDTPAAARGFAHAREVFAAAGNKVGAALAALRNAELTLQSGTSDAALAAAFQSAADLQAAGVDGWRREAELLAADALLAAGNVGAARALYSEVLEAASELRGLRAPCHTGLGLCDLRHEQREAARRQFQAAVRETEALRETLPGDEFRTAFGADKQRPYDGLIELALLDHDARAPWRLLCSIEQARVPALRSALLRGRESGALTEDQREQLHWLHAQWQQAVAEQALDRAAQWRQRIRAQEQALLEQARRAQAAAGAVPGAAAPPMSLPEDEALLRERIPEGTAVVVFGAVGHRLVACVLTRQSIARVIGSADGVADRIEQLRFQIDSLRFGAPALRKHTAQLAQRCQAHLQALHARVWQPLEALVAEYERLVIVPHRELHYLPFAALHDGQTSLIEHHEISLAPGLALWLEATLAPSTWRRAVALGVGGAGLPHVERELRMVAQAFRAQPGGEAALFIDEHATQAALRGALPGADVLHLACHGQFRADSPYFSALHLADGPMTLRDAAELPLTAQLVTLSACETGLSRIAPGDEQLGLLRGFLLAGAPRVLSTHWTVDDASTATLMASFYRSLLGGTRPAAALRAAQRELAQEHPHPYCWAPFALHERGR